MPGRLGPGGAMHVGHHQLGMHVAGELKGLGVGMSNADDGVALAIEVCDSFRTDEAAASGDKNCLAAYRVHWRHLLAQRAVRPGARAYASNSTCRSGSVRLEQGGPAGRPRIQGPDR